MKTFIKIAILVSVIVGAVVSVFVFSSTRIVEGVDVSHIKIQKSAFVDDIQEQISGLSDYWRKDFDKIDNLISVYYQHDLLTPNDEKMVKESLVDKAALKLTTFALSDYFQRSSWSPAEISSMKRNCTFLLNYKSANGDIVAQGDVQSSLESVRNTCLHFSQARDLSLVYSTNDDAKVAIESAGALRNDSYLMHELSIRSKLTNAAQTIHDSHWNQIEKSIRDLDTYTEKNLNSVSDFWEVREKISHISTLITAYNSADCYPLSSRHASNEIAAKKQDVNDIISDWNGKIESTIDESYTDSYFPYTQRIRRVRKYPNEQTIPNI